MFPSVSNPNTETQVLKNLHRFLSLLSSTSELKTSSILLFLNLLTQHEFMEDSRIILVMVVVCSLLYGVEKSRSIFVNKKDYNVYTKESKKAFIRTWTFYPVPNAFVKMPPHQNASMKLFQFRISNNASNTIWITF